MAARRYGMQAPVLVEFGTDLEKVGQIEDVTRGGTVRISTAYRVEVGERIRLSFQLPTPSAQSWDLQGTVVKVEKNESGGVWRYRLGVDFEKNPGALALVNFAIVAEGVLGDRRTHRRHPIWLPVEIAAAGRRNVLGVTHDVSASGMRVAVPKAVEVCDRVVVTFRVPALERRRIRGSIERCEVSPEDPEGAWPFHAVVRFDELQDVDSLLRHAKPAS